ncbi:MAG: glycosyltransferase family 2 protein [Patescibacteria group bacterium]|nr:glycosyltransferase family 2 protein [Patescibacteria group bacterium]
MDKKKIAIFVIAYNATTTISRVLDRIPTEVKEMVEEIFVFDDASKDDTHLVAEEWKRKTGLEKLTVFRNPVNLGYGGNQKRGYDYAVKRGYDIVVMLHGDGQYAPEALPEILAPLIADRAEAVFGSRMLVKGAARRGGMPLYKYVGNKVLTFFENWATGAHLSEWHSGYRAYATKALAAVPLQENTNDFHFDSEIIIQFLDHNFRIVEVPVPTYYGDEICYVNGMKYAANLFKIICQYKLHKFGIKKYAKFEKNTSASIYQQK